MLDHGEINKLGIVKKTTRIILYCLIPLIIIILIYANATFNLNSLFTKIIVYVFYSKVQ